MHLPQTAEYALRAMTQIVRMDEGRPVRDRSVRDRPIRADELARETRIPLAFLSKVLRRLVTHRLLKARTGRGGGFTLAREPNKICYLDILTAVGYGHSKPHCIFGLPRCGPPHPCPLHDSWSEIQASFKEWAVRLTLADLIQNAAPKTIKRKKRE